MNEAEHRPWGKARSFALALGCGVANAFLGALWDAALPFLMLAALVTALVVLGVQLGSRPRPFRWAAWVCFEVSLVMMAWVDLGAFARHAAGA